MNRQLDPDENDFCCPECKTNHITGVEIWGKYDGVLFWECMSCGNRWHRWPQGHYLRARAEPYVREDPDPEHPDRLPVEL